MEDPDQRSTYAAEEMVAAWLDAASSPEPRFGKPSEVAQFVDRVLDRLREQSRELGSNYRGREQRPVVVAGSFAGKRATYSDGVILLPERERGGAWALRGLVVLHELAHHLNTGIDGAIIDAHGEGFRATFVQLLEDIGWSEVAAMLREAYREHDLDRRHAADEGMLAKVGKLLRHAEGASTEAERDAFLTKAQELATTNSIELAVARASHERRELTQTPTFETIRLGHRGQQSNVRFIELMLAITRANDLRCSIRGDNTGVTVYGFQSDIDVAKAFYVSLVVQMVADADAYIRSGAHRPVHGRTARAAFYDGWTTRIEQRLEDARATARTSAESAENDHGQQEVAASTSTALALRAKEIEVDDYFGYMSRQHGIAGTWRGSSYVADDHSEARGRDAADRARLGSAKELTA